MRRVLGRCSSTVADRQLINVALVAHRSRDRSNTSGEACQNVHLQLVAGNVNVVQPQAPNVYQVRTIARR